MEKIINTNTKINTEYIDSHCHLQDYSQEKLVEILKSCESKNLRIFYSNATNKNDFESTLKLSLDNNNSATIKIIPGFGYHPWYLDDPLINNKDNWLIDFRNYIEDLSNNKKVKFFIGEIGIDGGKIKKKFSLDDQIEIFKQQLLMANEKKLYVHIHCVYEWDKLYKVMSNLKIDNLIENSLIILHSFQGKIKHIEKFGKMNCYFSISSGCFVNKNYDMLCKIPNDKLLFESDSPSMFNIEVYNNENEYKHFFNEKERLNSPESIVYLCNKMAEIKNIPKEELQKIVYENSMKIYKNFI